MWNRLLVVVFVGVLALPTTSPVQADEICLTSPMDLPVGSVMMGQPLGAMGFQVAAISLPGTVGETYTRPSHPIPHEKHPRTGMLAVRDNSGSPLLSVQRMGGFRMQNGVWLFESERPLDHGASQIVRVEARKNSNDIEPYATRFVRLIPGRIVYLDF
ncbi:MAG: hypothetical protein R3C20_10190 [Planctomycetaceae bacterium]